MYYPLHRAAKSFFAFLVIICASACLASGAREPTDELPRVAFRGPAEAYDLHLLTRANADEVPPDERQAAIVLTREAANGTLRVSIFDAGGERIIDTAEADLPNRSGEFDRLREMLAPLWDEEEVSADDKTAVIHRVTAIVGHPPIRQNAAHLTVNWEPEEDRQGLNFELQQADSPEFTDSRVRYQGPDRASFLAGLPEGQHFYRVRAIDPDTESAGPWSTSLEVIVEYQSLTLAFTLFGVGAVVFLATLILVVAGSIRARREEEIAAPAPGSPAP